MKIIAVEAIYLRLPAVEARTDSSQDALLVRIETDIGLVGWGEVDGSPLVAKAVIEAPMSHTRAMGLRDVLLGEDPRDIDRLWHKMYESTLYYGREGAVIQAMAGVDLALWDIKGKTLDLPVWKLLGGGHRQEIEVYSSNMFQFTPEETHSRAVAARDAGYRAVKFGWEPFGQTPAADCAQIEAIRDAMGPDARIMIDVGLVWDAKTTLQRARLFQKYDLFWLEEPLHPDDLTGYAKVTAGTDMRIAAGEEECTLAGFVRLMDQGGLDLIQVDLTRCGLTQSMRIAAEARRRGVSVVNHNFTTDINTAASLHFLCSLPGADIMEYCVEPGEISRKLALEPIRVDDGRARLPEAPGLGITPDQAIIEKYRYKAGDAEAVHGWCSPPDTGFPLRA